MQRNNPSAIEYTHTRASYIANCSPFFLTYKVCNDSPSENKDSWKAFSQASVPALFTKSTELLEKKIQSLLNLSVDFSEEDKKELLFMVEACIQMREQLDSVR